MKKKPKLVQIIQPPLCPYWHYDVGDGRVVIYRKRGTELTLAQANYALDLAKGALLSGHGMSDDKPSA